MKPKYDKLLSSSPFNFIFRLFNKGVDVEAVKVVRFKLQLALKASDFSA